VWVAEFAVNVMRVLVVDDDIIIRHYLQRTLRRHAEVCEAAGVGDALRYLRSTSFDIVVADEHMPDGSGRMLLARARSMQTACRCVLISGDDIELDENGSYERFFPKLGGLPVLVAWLRAAATEGGASGKAP
jgi:CheY-like chemotaxis protein